MRKIKRWFDIHMEGSVTVEAALVMSILLFFIASLLTGVFDIHTRVTGNLILQETLERYVHLEEEESAAELESNAQRDYRGYFWCQRGSIALSESGGRLSGIVKDKCETDITVRKFDPENFLRLLRAAGV